MDHPEQLGKIQETIDTATARTRHGNQAVMRNDTAKVVIGLEKQGNRKNWVITSYQPQEGSAPVPDILVPAARSPRGRGGANLPPTGASTSSVRGTAPKGNSPHGCKGLYFHIAIDDRHPGLNDLKMRAVCPLGESEPSSPSTTPFRKITRLF